MYHIVRPANHDAWLAERAKGIGSSEAGTILGVSHFDTPMKLWAKKVGLTPPTAETFAMEAGHELEPAIAHWYASRTGAYVLPDSVGDWLAVDNERPWRRVSPDRLFFRAGDARTRENLCILECKSTSRNVSRESFPQSWFWQVQYQMGVMGVRHAVIAFLTCYGGRYAFDWVEVEFDPDSFALLVEKLDHFWNVNVLQRIQPEQVLTNEDAQLRWREATQGSRLVASGEQEALVKSYLEAEKAKKEAEERMDGIALQIRRFMEDKETLVSSSDKVLLTYKNSSSVRFDTTAFKNARPDEYSQFTVSSQGRRLDFKRPRAASSASSSAA